MPAEQPAAHGRGAAHNPPNRFECLAYEADDCSADDAAPAPTTQFYKDHTRSIITCNDSPDVGFSASLNPYRGCEHGCAYCYARPTHEYLGLSAGLDFETRIFVKEEAPALLRQELASPRWLPQPLALSGVTDAYQPIERQLQLTRRCLEVLVEFRQPVLIITKNHLVTRDADLLAELARHQAAAVFLSITTLDTDLGRQLEPRASHVAGRLAAIEELRRAGIPVGVLAAPIIPALTDHEVPAILAAAAERGASFAGYTLLRLPHGVAHLFEQWLQRHTPEQKDKVLSRIRALRGGQLNDPRFGSRMRGEGELADTLKQLFALACRRTGIHRGCVELSTRAFRRSRWEQLELFD